MRVLQEVKRCNSGSAPRPGIGSRYCMDGYMATLSTRCMNSGTDIAVPLTSMPSFS